MKDDMAVISDSSERIRNSILYWTTTPKREEICVGTACKWNISCTKKLVADYKTRWNSTYLILESTLIYKRCVSLFETMGTTIQIFAY